MGNLVEALFHDILDKTKKGKFNLSQYELRKNTRLADSYKIYLDSIPTEPSSLNHRQKESVGNAWILPELGAKRVASISPEDWQKIIDQACSKGKKWKTLCNIRGAITGYCNHADKVQRILPYRSSTLELVIPTSKVKGNSSILQESDLATLFSKDYITNRWGKREPCHFVNLWRLNVVSGIRIGEGHGLWIEEIMPNHIPINRAVNDRREITDGKEFSAKRLVAKSELASIIIDKQIKYLQHMKVESKWLFPNIDGGLPAPITARRHWHRYWEEHGVTKESEPRKLRNLFVSMMKLGMPIERIKAILGHSFSMDTIAIYGEHLDKDDKILVDNLDEVLGNYVVPILPKQFIVG